MTMQEKIGRLSEEQQEKIKLLVDVAGDSPFYWKQIADLFKRFGVISGCACNYWANKKFRESVLDYFK